MRSTAPLCIALLFSLSLSAAAESAKKIELEPAFTATRPDNTQFVSLTKFPGRFTDPILFALDSAHGVHQLVASSGKFVGMVDASKIGAATKAPITAVSVERAELWLGDSAGGIHIFSLPEAKFIGSLKADSVNEALAMTFVDTDAGRDLFVLDRTANGYSLHHLTLTVRYGGERGELQAAEVAAEASIALPESAATPKLFHDYEKSQIVVIAGDSMTAFDYALKPTTTTISDKPLGNVQGLGLLSCPESLDKGYWLVAAKTDQGTELVFTHRETGVERARLQLDANAVDGPMLLDPEAMALFPNGVLYATQGNLIHGLSWDKIAGAAGVRSACF